LPFLAHTFLIPLPPEPAARLADLLDLGLASEEVRLSWPEGGTATPMPPAVLALVPDAPGTYWHYEELVVHDVSLPWAVIQGEVHARTTLDLAYAVCWAAGAWPLRDTVAAVLTGRLPFDEAVLMAAF